MILISLMKRLNNYSVRYKLQVDVNGQKTMRYPGYLHLARYRIHDLKLGDKLEVLKQCLQDAILVASIMQRRDKLQ